jgi:hypothetical protein
MRYFQVHLWVRRRTVAQREEMAERETILLYNLPGFVLQKAFLMMASDLFFSLPSDAR